MQGLGLVFVAVYQRALKLLYVDALLERLKAEFAEQVGNMASKKLQGRRFAVGAFGVCPPSPYTPRC